MAISSDQYAVKRICSYGSNPWAIIHLPTGKEVVGPDEEIEHPLLGGTVGAPVRTMIMGKIYYSRKRDAQVVLDRMLIAYGHHS